jgi:hypothetical protein
MPEPNTGGGSCCTPAPYREEPTDFARGRYAPTPPLLVPAPLDAYTAERFINTDALFIINAIFYYFYVSPFNIATHDVIPSTDQGLFEFIMKPPTPLLSVVQLLASSPVTVIE